MKKHRERGAVQLVSSAGKKTTYLVSLLRLGVAIFSAATLVSLTQAFARSLSVAMIVTICGFALLAGICGCLELIVGGAGARGEERRVRAKVLGAVFQASALPKNSDEKFNSARLIQLMTDNAERLTQYRQGYLGSTLAALITPLLVLIYVAIVIDPIIGLVMLASYIIVPILVIGFLQIFRKVSAKSRSQRAKLTTKYLDALRNLSAIRLFGAGPRFEKELRAQGERNRQAIMRLLAGNQIVIIVLDGAFSLFFVCLSVWITTSRLDAAEITLVQAVTVTLLLVLLIEPLQQLAGFFYVGMGGMAAQRAITSYLKMAKTNAEQDQARVAAARAKPAAASETDFVDKAISVNQMRYDYGRGEVLHDINLNVGYGEKASIIGRSGNGKSTLLGVLRGSLAVQAGRISIAGQDLADLSVEQIRALSATVSQTTWLFSGSVADNLAIAKPDASRDEMWQALERAHIADDIRQMSGGLDAAVGERGSLISGGQAQRISLARAFLSGRAILLLDEPTSQVDLESEHQIIQAIADIGRELTVVVVTHRKAILEIADHVYEMRDGYLHSVETLTEVAND